jgi:peptidyl-prolyl cis-trans isomerase SurA
MKRVAVKNVGVTVVVALALSIGLAAQEPQATPTPRPSAIIQKIIVKVNGEILTQTELEQLQIAAVRAQPNVAQIQDDATLQRVIRELTPKILAQSVDDLLLLQRGRELGFQMTEERFQTVLDSVKKDNNLDEAQLTEALKNEGMTLADYRNMIERTMVIDAVTRQEIIGQPNLTEAELRTYYTAHPDEFMTPASATLREIFVAVKPDTTSGQATINVADDDAAKAKVVAARERVVQGEDMAAVVQAVSESGSKANGGVIGPVKLADVNPVLRDAVSSLKAGDISQPIRTAAGYQVVKVESMTPAELAPFDTVREQIYQNILNSRVDGETQKYLVRLRDQAVIEWKDDSYKMLYEQGRANAAGGSGTR